jgi:hypothetical protein
MRVAQFANRAIVVVFVPGLGSFAKILRIERRLKKDRNSQPQIDTNTWVVNSLNQGAQLSIAAGSV